MDYRALWDAMQDAVAEDGSRADWDNDQWAAWFGELVDVPKKTALDVGAIYVALGEGAPTVMGRLRTGAADGNTLYADILDMLRSQSGIDMSLPVTATLLATITDPDDEEVKTKPLTESQAATLLALGVQQVTRAQSLGFRRVLTGYVGKARTIGGE